MTRSIGDKFVEWARSKPEICLVALVGSRARQGGGPYAADEHSDWDFHVVTTDVVFFAQSMWLAELQLKPIAYVERGGRLGDTRKVTAVFAEGEVDWVILRAAEFRGLIAPTMSSFDVAPPTTRQPVIHLGSVLEGGYLILKGDDEFGAFYRRAVSIAQTNRLSLDALKALADGFVCDYVSTLRKIQRGEFLAARRWLHVHLIETVFRLVHEQRIRSGLASIPDARKLEQSGESRLGELNVEILLTRQSLRHATEKTAETLCDLMRELAADAWHWPDLTPLRLRAK